ncbi:MAG: GDP-mannose 4,6-dehydratase [candidate division WOR-3 bacterium]|nr:MAG: GDP-mannose 4,6-dehydratase [candidate division WOR-3 bacterium]
MKVVFVTGCEGFVGSYLVKALRESLYKVEATCYPLLLPKEGTCKPLDVLNPDMTKEALKESEPDVVFHLAAVSSVSKSIRDAALTYDTNIMGTVNLLEAVKGLEKKVRFIFISTCEVYGDGGGDITEDAPIVLNNPYAVSKYAAELVCRDYVRQGFDCVILRAFTHTGPGQARGFVLPHIAAQVAEIEKNKRPPLVELGNIDVMREFMNIADVMSAYVKAIDVCEAGRVYNVASGQGYSIRTAVDIYKELAKTPFEVKTQPSKIRPNDTPRLIGNGKRFMEATGWQPQYRFEKTIEDLLNYWRAKV